MPLSPQCDKLINAITNNDLKQAYLAIKGDADVNCFFYQHYTDNFTHAQSDYLYALHYAASLGQYDMVTLLLENGAYRHNTINLISDEVNESVSAAMIATRCGYEEIHNLIVTWAPRKARVSKRVEAELKYDSEEQSIHQALIKQNKLLTDTVVEQANEIARLKATIESLTNALANKNQIAEPSRVINSSEELRLFGYRQ